MAEEKRKNDRPRRFPWWLLFVGFAAGVLVTLMVTGGRGAVTVFASDRLSDVHLLTATRIIADATLTAQAPIPGNQTLDASFATATAFILQASQQAAIPLTPTVNPILMNATLDPLLVEATRIVATATRQSLEAAVFATVTAVAQQVASS